MKHPKPQNLIIPILSTIICLLLAIEVVTYQADNPEQDQDKREESDLAKGKYLAANSSEKEKLDTYTPTQTEVKLTQKDAETLKTDITFSKSFTETQVKFSQSNATKKMLPEPTKKPPELTPELVVGTAGYAKVTSVAERAIENIDLLDSTYNAYPGQLFRASYFQNQGQLASGIADEYIETPTWWCTYPLVPKSISSQENLARRRGVPNFADLFNLDSDLTSSDTLFCAELFDKQDFEVKNGSKTSLGLGVDDLFSINRNEELNRIKKSYKRTHILAFVKRQRACSLTSDFKDPRTWIKNTTTPEQFDSTQILEPLAYVKTVDYGRVVIVIFKLESTDDEFTSFRQCFTGADAKYTTEEGATINGSGQLSQNRETVKKNLSLMQSIVVIDSSTPGQIVRTGDGKGPDSVLEIAIDKMLDERPLKPDQLRPIRFSANWIADDTPFTLIGMSPYAISRVENVGYKVSIVLDEYEVKNTMRTRQVGGGGGWIRRGWRTIWGEGRTRDVPIDGNLNIGASFQGSKSNLFRMTLGNGVKQLEGFLLHEFIANKSDIEIKFKEQEGDNINSYDEMVSAEKLKVLTFQTGEKPFDVVFEKGNVIKGRFVIKEPNSF